MGVESASANGRGVGAGSLKRGVTKNFSWALGRAIPFFANIAVHIL